MVFLFTTTIALLFTITIVFLLTISMVFLFTISKDCLVSFQTNRYSVPHRFVGQQVEVQSDHDFIRIYHQGELIALHPRRLSPTSPEPTLKIALKSG